MNETQAKPVRWHQRQVQLDYWENWSFAIRISEAGSTPCELWERSRFVPLAIFSNSLHVTSCGQVQRLIWFCANSYIQNSLHVTSPTSCRLRMQTVTCVGKRATSLLPVGQNWDSNLDSSSHHTGGSSPRRKRTRSRLMKQLMVLAAMNTQSSS